MAGWVLLVCCSTGCAWRTSRADHLIGPVLYRFSEPTVNNQTIVQTWHAPLLIEGGRQWGLSLGAAHRLALAPQAPGAAAADETVRGWLVQPRARRWQVSWFYLRAPLRETPVFIRRGVTGLHAGGGMEERAFTLGYSAMTATRPGAEAVYQLDFHSRHPLETKFVVQSAEDFQPIPTTSPRHPKKP